MIDNPRDKETGRPVCPVCLQVIDPGPNVLRDDNLAVHLECFDGVTRWWPHVKEPSPAEPLCLYCESSIGLGTYVTNGNVSAHFDCWMGEGATPLPESR